MDIHHLTGQEAEEQRRQHLRPDFPYAYGISLGEWPCNRSCRMCPMHAAPPGKARFMEEAVFRRACEVVGNREVSLEISAYGEPYQHPHLDDWLPLARALCPKAHIVVATNGALLDEARCLRIVDSGIDHLSFSLDAGSPESYKWLTGSDDYGRVCANLERLAEIKARRGAGHLRITTHIIGLKELAHEFESFVRRWSPLVDSAVVRNYGNWAGLVDANGVSPAKSQPVPEERYPCAWLWYATKIEPDGAVSKCFIHVTGDRNPLGNIMREDFEAVWTGLRMKKLRGMHCRNRHAEIEHCGSCIVWSLFPHFWKKRKKWGIFPDPKGEWI
ncbi:MAG: radical SAM protein [Deltaproteobacteria bacterium]|jgi:radical SAM protein with 4Fe4S-binding SPASM domain|nr:radical SAM protein [Deltaproteobacteria bacterium]